MNLFLGPGTAGIVLTDLAVQQGCAVWRDEPPAAPRGHERTRS